MRESATPNVVLVGFMGTGKTTAGRLLAERLGRPWRDTDDYIRREAGLSVPAIFSRLGEERFRELETRAAAEYSEPWGLVLSTGGGILGTDENVELLRRGGVLVCLTARPGEIIRRIRNPHERPMLLTAATPEEAVARLLEERAPRYALADWTLDTTDLSSDQVTEAICTELPSLFQRWSTRS